MKNKLLILGLSCNLDQFIREEKICFNTWAKPIREGKYKNISMYFFRGAENESIDEENGVMFVKGRDDISHTYEKTYNALQFSLKIFDFDWVIITNTATVLNLPLINELLNSNLLDENKYYGGEFIFPIKLTPFFRGNFILLSKTNIKKLKPDNSDLGANDIVIFDEFLKIDNIYANYLKKFVQLNGVFDIKRISINEIGSNFFISTKAYDRKNSDAIVVNIVGCTSLLKSDKKKYDITKLLYAPKYITANTGMYKIEKIEDYSRIKGLDDE